MLKVGQNRTNAESRSVDLTRARGVHNDWWTNSAPPRRKKRRRLWLVFFPGLLWLGKGRTFYKDKRVTTRLTRDIIARKLGSLYLIERYDVFTHDWAGSRKQTSGFIWCRHYVYFVSLFLSIIRLFVRSFFSLLSFFLDRTRMDREEN